MNLIKIYVIIIIYFVFYRIFNNIISLFKFYFIFNINLKSKYKVYNYLENPIYIIQLKLNYLSNLI